LSWIVRGCLVTLFLTFVILPLVGVAFAVWLLLTPTSWEVAAATAYKNAPICSASTPEQGCIHTERAEIVSYTWIPGKCGGHTDRFALRLADGTHHADIKFDCLASSPSYASSDGRVAVREYRGLVTTVYDVDGQAHETTDSPTGGASWRGGVAALMLIVFGGWLLAVMVIVIGVKLTSKRQAC
jgi:hypothetical protein